MMLRKGSGKKIPGAETARQGKPNMAASERARLTVPRLSPGSRNPRWNKTPRHT